MNKELKIAILIMAAGESRRMNGIKQLLPWKGTSLLNHTINVLKGVQKESIFVVLGAYSEEIRKAIDFRVEEVTILENLDWRNGLGSSIAYGIRHVLNLKNNFDGVLICLADQPLLHSDYYKKMIMEFGSGINPIVASRYKDKIGVPALFARQIASELMELKEDHGAKHILSKYEARTTIVHPKELIKDIDTTEEYLEIYNQYN
ncbi:nucleotidyltransferase family protein [Maribacter aestuarii]|uniref:nucleotidyltransferase family protein n=1 Tax=Maribacter aestuarii TaxID=1130723 RepID=UPI00248B4DB0|nr:nucleotidyltransferase family protein [Maribacter aestuarii]